MSSALNLLLQGMPQSTQSDSPNGSNSQAAISSDTFNSAASRQGKEHTASFSDVLGETNSTQGAPSTSPKNPELLSQNTLDSADQSQPTIVLDKLSRALSSNVFFNAPSVLASDTGAEALKQETGSSLPPAGKDVPEHQALSAEAKAILDRAIDKLFGSISSLDSRDSAQLTSSPFAGRIGVNDTGVNGTGSESETTESPVGILASESILEGNSKTLINSDPIFEGLAFIPSDSQSVGQASQALKESANSRLINSESAIPFSGYENGLVSKIQSATTKDVNTSTQEREVLPTALQRFSINQRRQQDLADSFRNRAEPQAEQIVQRSSSAESNRPVSAALQSGSITANLVGEFQASSRSDSGIQNNSSHLSSQAALRLEPAVSVSEAVRSNGEARVSVPFNQQSWGENLSRQITLLVARNFESAQIQLEPPELGPLQVRFQVQQDQVSVQFVSSHSVVRDAVEQTVARLQELFQEEGLDLVDVNVTDQESGKQYASKGEGDLADAANPEEGDEKLTQSLSLPLSDGKIDYFI